MGKEIGGKKGTSITKKTLRSIVMEIAKEYRERRGCKGDGECAPLTVADRSVEECVLELVELDEEKRKKNSSSADMINDESSGDEVSPSLLRSSHLRRMHTIYYCTIHTTIASAQLGTILYYTSVAVANSVHYCLNSLIFAHTLRCLDI